MVFHKFNKIMEKISTILAVLAGVFILVMLFHIVADVLIRNIFHIVMTGTYERSQYIYMPMIILPALSFTYISGVLPKFDGLSSKGSKSFKLALDIFIAVVELIIFFLLMRYSFTSASLAIGDQKAVAAGSKMVATWWVYCFCPIGFTIMFFTCLAKKLDYFFGPKDEKKE